MSNFFRTTSSFFFNKYINPYKAFFRHIVWQFRKLLNGFPHDICFGGIKVRIHSKEVANGVGALINAVGYYDPNNMRFLLSLTQSGTIRKFLDVGANIGIYSLIISTIYGTKSYAFEPHPITFKYLCENVYINQFEAQITCVQMGLGSVEGEVNFRDVPGSAINKIVSSPSGEKCIKVRFDTGDNFCSSRDFLPDSIKIDVEGYENEVLIGMTNIIQYVKIIFIECKNLNYTEKILCPKLGFLGPYQVDYELKILTKRQIHNEDWIFINKKYLPSLKDFGYKFEN